METTQTEQQRAVLAEIKRNPYQEMIGTYDSGLGAIVAEYYELEDNTQWALEIQSDGRRGQPRQIWC